MRAHLMKSIPRDSSESVPSSGGIKAGLNPELEMYNIIIHRYDLVETFANVEISLRLYLCMFVTNCAMERSFSKLKLIKNYLRGHEAAPHVFTHPVEHEKLRVLHFTDIK